MKLISTTLIISALITAAQCQNDISISTDFLSKLSFAIDETDIPNYLVHIIYEHSEENNFTTQQILDLYTTPDISLATTEDILERLSIDHSRVFSIENFKYTLDLLKWDFRKFYNEFVDRLQIRELQKVFLPILQINFNLFINDMGVGDPWYEFSKGNFSRENMVAASQSAGVDLETVWSTTKALLTPNLAAYNITPFLDLLKGHGINENEAVIIWKGTPVSIQQVYNTPVFNSLIQQALAKASNLTVLGAVIGEREIIIHRNVYEQFSPDRRALKITVNTLVSNTSLEIEAINDTAYRSFVALQPGVVPPVLVKVAQENTNLVNCSYVSPIAVDNFRLVTTKVPSASYKDYTYTLPLNLQEVIPGSALVCNDTLYGLAREAVGEAILVDAFAVYEPPHDSASHVCGCMGLLVLVIMQFVM